MSQTDSRGVPVSTNSRTVLQRLETATQLLAGYSGDPLGTIDSALASDPDFVMGHAFCADSRDEHREGRRGYATADRGDGGGAAG